MDDKLQRINEIQSAEQQTLENFQMLLNAFPNKEEIKINDKITLPDGSHPKYLPISVIESLLDTHFSGLWNAVNFRWEVISNEVVGSIDLKVFHPIAKIWITRTGTAAAMIMTTKNLPATVENKIKNTLVKDFPHLKSECIKNAAKSLGVRFGRSLNRGKDDEYVYLSSIVEQTAEGAEEAIALLNTAVTDQYDILKSKIQRATPANMRQLIDYLRKLQPNE